MNLKNMHKDTSPDVRKRLQDILSKEDLTDDERGLYRFLTSSIGKGIVFFLELRAGFEDRGIKPNILSAVLYEISCNFFSQHLNSETGIKFSDDFNAFITDEFLVFQKKLKKKLLNDGLKK